MKIDERMKKYEYVSRQYLICKQPVIIRLDGRAFHSFTRGFQKPFDNILVKTMQDTMNYLCENISNCRFGYTQSDEISLLLIDDTNTETQAWFDNNLSKLVSISASMATLAFNKFFKSNVADAYLENDKFDTLPYEAKFDTATFDARAFNLPNHEVNNYFIWRQQDCARNSIQMVGQATFSHKQLQNKNCKDILEMLKEKGINYDKDFPTYLKQGTCAYKKYCSYNVTRKDAKTGYIFTQEVTRNKWIIDLDMPNLVIKNFFIKEKTLHD